MNRVCLTVSIPLCLLLCSCHALLAPMSEEVPLPNARAQADVQSKKDTLDQTIASIASTLHVHSWYTAPRFSTRIDDDATAIVIGSSPQLGIVIVDHDGLLREFAVGSAPLRATAYPHPMHATNAHGTKDAWTGDPVPPRVSSSVEHRCDGTKSTPVRVQSREAIDPYANISWIDASPIAPHRIIETDAPLIYVAADLDQAATPYGVRGLIQWPDACTLIGIAHPYASDTTRYIPLTSLLSVGAFYRLDRH
jgi:hypothetical protein